MNTMRENKTVLRRPVRTITEANISEEKIRIAYWMGVSMLVVAVSIDAFNALLNVLVIGEFLSSIISVAATTLFVIWFWMLGVSFVKSPKKLAAMGGQALIGLIPVINTLPELTAGVAITLFLTWGEDKNGIIGRVANTTQKLGIK